MKPVLAVVVSLVVAAATPEAAAQPPNGDRCAARSGRGDAGRAKALYTEAAGSANVERRLELFTRSLDEHPTWEASYHLAATLEKAGRDREARGCFVWAFGLTDRPAEKAQAAARVGMTYQLPGCAAERITWLKESLKLQRFPTVERALKDAVEQQAGGVKSAAAIQAALAPCDPSDGTAARSFGVEPSVDVRIHFAYDRADLTPDGARQAQELGRALASDAFAGNAFLLIGHTDARGDDAYNDALSRSRAEAVRAFLARDYPQLAGRIRVDGRGKRELLVLGTTEQDHALNRRVEVVLMDR
jgi:outer membrane protein OmpA-like peptidoglycan-associated protein